MAPCSLTVAWKFQWTEKPGGLQSMELQRAGHTHDWAHTHTWNYGKQHAIPIKHKRGNFYREGEVGGQGWGVLKTKIIGGNGICSIAAFYWLSGNSLHWLCDCQARRKYFFLLLIVNYFLPDTQSLSSRQDCTDIKHESCPFWLSNCIFVRFPMINLHTAKFKSSLIF